MANFYLHVSYLRKKNEVTKNLMKNFQEFLIVF